MLRWERGTVTSTRGAWRGVSRHLVAIGDEQVRALAYLELTGEPDLGETVLVNTNALRRGLGTGGEALVVARPGTVDAGGDSAVASEPVGHLVKARYTPMQTMVSAIDDPDSPHYGTVRAATGLSGMPVVVTDLHSALPAIVAGARLERPDATIAYVHADGAALPAAYSATAAALRESGQLAATISAGQSFGGDLEAVTVHSALLGARHVVGADLAIVIQGPGNLGTGTGWGFSGVQAVEALHAASILDGDPIGALRVSEADERDRHRGLSHHATTVFGRAALASIALPVLSPDDPAHSPFHAGVTRSAQEQICAVGDARGLAHALVEVGADGIDTALRSLPVRLSTMGRGLDEDYAAFLYPALAGRAAALRTRC